MPEGELPSIRIIDIIEQLDDSEYSVLKKSEFDSRILFIKVIEQLNNSEYPFLKETKMIREYHSRQSHLNDSVIRDTRFFKRKYNFITGSTGRRPMQMERSILLLIIIII